MPKEKKEKKIKSGETAAVDVEMDESKVGLAFCEWHGSTDDCVD